MSHPTSDLCFFLNGQKVVLTDVQPEVTLIEFLRSKGLTGTKLGCGEVRRVGVLSLRVVSCGLWTVFVTSPLGSALFDAAIPWTVVILL
jgi:xanthine dehydrogenase iron-sulfur cluster and FAD-binding subunit A